MGIEQWDMQMSVSFKNVPTGKIQNQLAVHPAVVDDEENFHVNYMRCNFCDDYNLSIQIARNAFLSIRYLHDASNNRIFWAHTNSGDERLS